MIVGTLKSPREYAGQTVARRDGVGVHLAQVVADGLSEPGGSANAKQTFTRKRLDQTRRQSPRLPKQLRTLTPPTTKGSR